ncbi:MAG: T9SS type A sorting domain-containing protein [Flavobacteriaceae bacterium]|nr:T9SS type A sorting domain-containing protein [Flavobacteriaceae bacterium]
MKTKITMLIILGMLSIPAQATSILASSFGWNGIDDTQALYDAFTANVDTLYVDLQIGDWVSGPLIFDNIVNDKIVIFERDVKINALENAFDSYLYNGLFTFINCSNVSLIGYGATLEMNKNEYINLNDGSEWRHIIALNGCNNFNIYGLKLINSGGDGIEVSGIWQQPIPSTNIHIKDCLIDNNYRQGISVTSAQNVLIEHCKITNTSGTPPAFGIDLEPDNPYDEMSGIEIKNCRITGNQGGGILLAFWLLNETSNPVSVSVSDCYIGSNQNQGIVVDVNSSGPVSGQVTFERCIIENQPANGIFSNKRESLFLEFNDIILRNVGYDNTNNDPLYNMPIAIQKQYNYNGLPLGNITFNDVFIDDNLFDRDFLTIDHWGQSTQVENISGNFSIYNPNGISYYIDNPLVNVTITTQSIASLPLAEINLSTNDDTAYETGNDTTATFTVSRTANDISFPLGVNFFMVTGLATNRLDYHYFPEALVIPANYSDVTYTITAIEDELTEPSENLNLVIKPETHYSILDGIIQLFIEDTTLGINEFENTLFSMYPNPVKNNINISTELSEINEIKIFNTLGQLLETFNTENNRINVSFLNSGVYFLQLNSPSGRGLVKFIKE